MKGEIKLKAFTPDKLRNIVLGGHGSSGKTSLVEALLYQTNGSDRHGKISDGTTVCDFDPEEIKRKITVSLSLAPVFYEDYKINFIDTPGQFDFEGAFYEGFRAAETVLIAVSGKSGCNVGTTKAFKAARKAGKASVIFVTKMDNPQASFFKTIDSLKEELGKTICPIFMPIRQDEVIVGYINIIEKKAYSYKDGKRTEIPMPENKVDRYDQCLEMINEAVAECDDELMEKYFAGEEFTIEELARGLRHGVKEGLITPVICGSAEKLEGIDMLLFASTYLCPSAARAGGETATKGGDEIEVDCDISGKPSGYIFKTIADPFVGKLSFIKVVSGVIKSDSQLINVRTDEPEKLGKILFVKGKKQEEIKEISAGDIAAITKLSNAVTGDTLSDASFKVSYAGVITPRSCMQLGVLPTKKGDESKIAAGLARLIEEDPTVAFTVNHETHQQLISGLGEQHLDVTLSKLTSKFGVEVKTEPPIVPYRETIRKKVTVEGKHKKQSGGHGQYGHVKIEFEPGDGDGLIFEEKVFGGSVPKNYFPAVEKGLQDSIKRGTLAGYPMVALKARLIDGSYHPVDSSEMAFKLAAQVAYKEGIPKASPMLLEPVGSLKAYVPDANTGDVMGEMNKRRGRVLGMNPAEEGMTCIEAEVPISEMHDFTTFIRSLTRGRGNFELDFLRYEGLPQQFEAEVIAKAKVLFANDHE